jgi:HSP20 family molecular chaperone IbpA
MGFFDDDPFEDFVNQFFNRDAGYQRGENEMISGESDERMIDFIETDNDVFIIFELPGYSKEDVEVSVDKAEIEVVAKKKVGESVVPYLAHKLSSGVELRKPLPKSLQKKKHELNFKNGILELRFKK